MDLCDGSRQIVFRLHRVTEEQVKQLVREFEDAVAVIRGWHLDYVEPQEKALICKYGEHIENRASRLTRALAPSR